MVNEMTKEDLIQWAWLAGLIDGEGCFSVDVGTPKKYGKALIPKIRIVLSEDHKHVLEKVQGLAGGTILFRNIGNCTNPKLRNTKDQYEWVLSGVKNTRNFTNIIKPFLVLKKDTCDRFLNVIILMENKVHLTNYSYVEEKRKTINGGRPGRGIK